MLELCLFFRRVYFIVYERRDLTWSFMVPFRYYLFFRRWLFKVYSLYNSWILAHVDPLPVFLFWQSFVSPCSRAKVVYFAIILGAKRSSFGFCLHRSPRRSLLCRPSRVFCSLSVPVGGALSFICSTVQASQLSSLFITNKSKILNPQYVRGPPPPPITHTHTVQTLHVKLHFHENVADYYCRVASWTYRQKSEELIFTVWLLF